LAKDEEKFSGAYSSNGTLQITRNPSFVHPILHKNRSYVLSPLL